MTELLTFHDGVLSVNTTFIMIVVVVMFLASVLNDRPQISVSLFHPKKEKEEVGSDE